MFMKHTFKHVDVSDSLKEYAEDQISKSSRYLLKESSGHIFYSKGKHNDCLVEITVQNGTGYFKASAHSDDFYEAVDEAADKLSKQFLKTKEKLKTHKSFSRSKEGQLEHVNERLEYELFESYHLPAGKRSA